MTRHETERAESVLDYLKRAQRFIRSDRTQVAVVNNYPNAISYVNRDGKGLDTIDKFCGSDLQMLDNAIEGLEGLLRTRGFGRSIADNA